MSGQIILGPILGFRGLKENCWCTSALVVVQSAAHPLQLTIAVGGRAQAIEKATLLKTQADCSVWRLDWGVEQTSEEQAVDYTINGGQTYRYVVPAQNIPLRICYGSCFGVHTLKDVNKLKNKNALWKVLQQVHHEKPYHLFFLGGDQVYSDQVWETVAPLRNWLNTSLKKRLLAPFTPEMAQQVAQFYFDLYLRMWRQKEPAAVLSQIPTLMMWDDHDIFDGWGSYPPKLQACAVFQGIFNQAREYFRLFQLQARDDEDLAQPQLPASRGYTYAFRFGDLALIALDLRSERTQQQVMSPETRLGLQNWLQAELRDKLPLDSSPRAGGKHLLIMSGIPIVNVDLTLLEAALDFRPGHQRTEDDLKDQWLSLAHRQERQQLIEQLIQFSRETGWRVTLVSGDAHVAFTGYIQADADPVSSTKATEILQLTSSAMVNIPPPTLVLYMMEKLLANKIETVSSGISTRLLDFPGTTQRFLGTRNWLSLTLLQEQQAIRAEWYAEGHKQPFGKVIPPVSPDSD